MPSLLSRAVLSAIGTSECADELESIYLAGIVRSYRAYGDSKALQAVGGFFHHLPK
jgi:hypothetical protein